MLITQKLGYVLSSPISLVLPSQSKENSECIYGYMTAKMLQIDQRHNCAFPWDVQPSNHLCNWRHQTVGMSQCQPARDVLWDTIQRSSCFVELTWIYTQLEGAVCCLAQVNSYCLGHDYSLAISFVGILFHILLYSHNTTESTSREQGDRRTARFHLHLPNDQQHMILHCTARIPTEKSDLLCHAGRHFGAQNIQHSAV